MEGVRLLTRDYVVLGRQPGSSLQEGHARDNFDLRCWAVSVCRPAAGEKIMGSSPISGTAFCFRRLTLLLEPHIGNFRGLGPFEFLLLSRLARSVLFVVDVSTLRLLLSAGLLASALP